MLTKSLCAKILQGRFTPVYYKAERTTQLKLYLKNWLLLPKMYLQPKKTHNSSNLQSQIVYINMLNSTFRKRLGPLLPKNQLEAIYEIAQIEGKILKI